MRKAIGSFLYHGRAVDITTLKALNSLAARQSKATQNTVKNTKQFLDCIATHPISTIRFYPSDMMLQIHSDASFMNEQKARSTAGGHYFLGNKPDDNQPLFLNGAVYTLCAILKHVAASAAEAELGALFLNCQEGKMLRLTLTEMGHPQPPTPAHADNATAVGIANNTVKKQRSRAMDMRCFWVADKVEQGQFRILWCSGQENLGDYVSKHHLSPHHLKMRPYYSHQKDSPRTLRRALPPSVMRGCAKLTGTTPHQTRVPARRASMPCSTSVHDPWQRRQNHPFLTAPAAAVAS